MEFGIRISQSIFPMSPFGSGSAAAGSVNGAHATPSESPLVGVPVVHGHWAKSGRGDVSE